MGFGKSGYVAVAVGNVAQMGAAMRTKRASFFEENSTKMTKMAKLVEKYAVNKCFLSYHILGT